MFIDEARFSINMKNNWARSTIGTSAIVEVEKTHSPSHTIFGAIHPSSIIHFAMKKPLPTREKYKRLRQIRVKKSKKRKPAGDKDQRVSKTIIGKPVIEYVEVESSDGRESNKPPSKGTTAAHFIKFMNKMLDIMDMDDLSQRIADACNNVRFSNFRGFCSQSKRHISYCRDKVEF